MFPAENKRFEGPDRDSGSSSSHDAHDGPQAAPEPEPERSAKKTPPSKPEAPPKPPPDDEPATSTAAALPAAATLRQHETVGSQVNRELSAIASCLVEHGVDGGFPTTETHCTSSSTQH